MKAHGIPLEGIASGRTRVLIVDDEKEVVEVMERILTEQTSYEVKSEVSGFQAGMECERFKPHVILLDLHLGDGDGRQFADMVRKNEHLTFTKIGRDERQAHRRPVSGPSGPGVRRVPQKALPATPGG